MFWESPLREGMRREAIRRKETKCSTLRQEGKSCYRSSKKMFCKLAHADACGQATVEFALIMAAFMALAVALSALVNAFESGLFLEHALMSASHHVQLSAPGILADIFLY